MLRGIHTVLSLVLVAVMLAAVPLAGPASAKDVVVVYTAIENEQITEYMRAINKSLPNIELKILRFSTGDISARFMAEKDNMQADVIWGVAATNQLIFKNADCSAPRPETEASTMFPQNQPARWVGMTSSCPLLLLSGWQHNRRRHLLGRPCSPLQGHGEPNQPARIYALRPPLQQMARPSWKYLTRPPKYGTRSPAQPGKTRRRASAIGVSFSTWRRDEEEGAPV